MQPIALFLDHSQNTVEKKGMHNLMVLMMCSVLNIIIQCTDVVTIYHQKPLSHFLRVLLKTLLLESIAS